MKKPLVVIGAGGFAREAFSWLPPEYQVEAFYSNLGPPQNSMFGVPVIRDLDGMSGSEFLVAIGEPQAKKKLWEMAISRGLFPCDPIIHPTATVGRDCRMGRGSILCPQSVVTTNVSIGVCFLLNLGATIGHDCEVADFVTVSPGANVSGGVVLGEASYIGTNSCIREKVFIGADSTVGMGSVVVKTVSNGMTVVGNPARQMHKP